MKVSLHPHAAQRLRERGATREEVEATVKAGARFPARFGRTGFKRNFAFGGRWRAKRYANKQVIVYAVPERGGWLAITVITKFF